MTCMKRREFISLIGGAAAALPVVAHAQQARTPVLGFLGSAAEADYKSTTAALRRGLNEAGYVEKQNLLIDYRWADFQYERLPALAAELVKRPVDAIFATILRGLPHLRDFKPIVVYQIHGKYPEEKLQMARQFWDLIATQYGARIDWRRL
jgi:hypothetical protein